MATKTGKSMAEQIKREMESAMHVVSHNSPKESFHNVLPPNFREITEEEFAKSDFFTYTFERMDFRQCLRDSEGNDLPKMLQIHLYFMHDGTGFAMENDFWGGKIRYYAFGCKHKYREMSQQEARKRGISHFGMCYHVYECSECGDITAQDSSD